jgi:hypothetical protein
MSGFEQRDRPRLAVMPAAVAGRDRRESAEFYPDYDRHQGRCCLSPVRVPAIWYSFCRNANAEKTAIHCYLCTHWHIRFTRMPSFEAPWMQRSELGRKIPVDLEADAHFDECRSCP